MTSLDSYHNLYNQTETKEEKNDFLSVFLNINKLLNTIYTAIQTN